MMKKISFIIVSAIFSLIIPFGYLHAEEIIDNPLKGLDTSAGQVTAYSDQLANPDDNFLATKAGQIISIALSFVGALFFILMIYAGILWMTAAGNEQQISKAKGLLINAIIGIIVVLSAYALTAFLGNNLL